MADIMEFPDTVEEFMEQYKLVDNEKIYTNGIELIPIFRMEQWFEHLDDDVISRAEAQTELQFAAKRYTMAHEANGEGKVVWSDYLISVKDAMNVLRDLSSIQSKGNWEVNNPPKKIKQYLVQYKGGGMDIAIWTDANPIYPQKRMDWHWAGPAQSCEVIAWHELPKFYKKNKDE